MYRKGENMLISKGSEEEKLESLEEEPLFQFQMALLPIPRTRGA